MSKFIVYAACSADQLDTELGCIPQDPSLFASKLYGIGLGLIGGVALIFIIYGGYLIMTSQGDPIKLEKGKSYVVSAIIGLILAISGFGLYRVITSDIIRIPGF